MKRTANARWEGGLRDGKGFISTQSGALSEAKYEFLSRFEDAPGTNPDELIGAAISGCFSLSLAGQLNNVAKVQPEKIETQATVTLEKLEAGWTVTQVHLDCTAKVPGVDPAMFQQCASNAHKGCAIARLLNTNITMEAKLV